MSLFDAAWFYVEKPEAPAHFGPLAILTPPAGAGPGFIRDLVEQWRQNRAFAPPFNYVLAGGLVPRWRVLPKDAIDIDYHLRHSALPAPGGERELGVLVSRLQSHALDRHRPLWECHVIEGLENGRFAIYLKLHHGQFDGVGAARLLGRTFSTDPEARGLQPPWAVGMGRPERQRGQGPGRLRAIGQTLGALPRMARTLADFGREAYLEGRTATAAPFQAPDTVFNGRISPQRRFATQHYTLARFKKLAKAAQVSVNDVFLSICGGALRRYLTEFDLLPDRSLVGQVPVNVRAPGDASVGNSIAFIYARLHTDIADPIQRLAAIHASTEAGKQRHESVPAAVVSAYTMVVQAPYMAQVILGLGGRVRPAANLVISNVPGPPMRLYFNGSRIDHLYGPSVLFHGQALNITMTSYVDEVDIGFTGCRDSLPSMQRLAVYTGEALDDLEAALA